MEYSKERNLLEIDCTGCDARPDLRKQKCFTGLLLAFDSGLSIERVVLSGTIVKMYTTPSVELLSRTRSVLDALSAIRAELNQRVQLKKELKHCRGCQLDPRKLFGELEAAFLSGLTEFFSTLRKMLEVAKEDGGPRCELCLFQTKTDALILLDEAMLLRRFALKEGLGIVEG